MPPFEDFLRFGKLGLLSMGMTKDGVRELVGDPTDVSIRRHPEIWRYGPIELAFYQDSKSEPPLLTSITHHFIDQLDPPSGWDLNGWIPTSQTGLDEFRAYLHQLGLPARDGQGMEPELSLVLESGVKITFDEEGRLSSVGTSPQAAVERKQVSVSVLREEWRALDREAKSRGMSPSALCSLWIREQILGLQTQETHRDVVEFSPRS